MGGFRGDRRTGRRDAVSYPSGLCRRAGRSRPLPEPFRTSYPSVRFSDWRHSEILQEKRRQETEHASASSHVRQSVTRRLTAVVDGVGDDGFQRPCEPAVAVLEVRGELQPDDVQVHHLPQLLRLLQDGVFLQI